MKLRIALLTMIVASGAWASFNCKASKGSGMLSIVKMHPTRAGDTVFTFANGTKPKAEIAQSMFYKSNQQGLHYKFTFIPATFDLIKVVSSGGCHRASCHTPPGSRLPNPKPFPKIPPQVIWNGKFTMNGKITYYQCTQYGPLLF